MANSKEFLTFAQQFRAAVDGGLVAAGYVYRNRVVEKLTQGYTSGDFVTPHVALTVRVSAALDLDGKRVVLVGTDVMYALYWEMGHQNRFTRRFERVEHWRLAMLETAPAQFAAFGRVFSRAFQGGGTSRAA